jgi:hypothetical protein
VKRCDQRMRLLWANQTLQQDLEYPEPNISVDGERSLVLITKDDIPDEVPTTVFDMGR